VTGLTGASLNDMRAEVQRFGAQGLGKWDKAGLGCGYYSELNFVFRV